MTKFKDKTVLITGGASGIGFLLAKRSIQKGASNIIILDINDKALDESQEKLRSSKCSILSIKTDITVEEDLLSAIAKIDSENLKVDILINNAGVVTGKSFSEHNFEEIDLNMGVNAVAPMKLTSLLLKQMISRKKGHIVNISSAASLLSNPRMSVYCASKWALTGWSDSLRIEMEKSKTGVRVLTVTPYYINTGMFKGVRSAVIPILKPANVADSIIKAIEKDKIILRTPWIIYLLPFVKGILPRRLLDFVVGRLFGIYRSMDTFKGRNNDEV